MKTFTYTLIALLALVGLGGCTHNEGDIGPWFGTWQVEVVADCNAYSTDYENQLKNGTHFFQFQADMIAVRYVYLKSNNLYHSEIVDYGTWSEENGKLTISFPDPNVASHLLLDNLAAGTTENNTYRFDVITRSDKCVELKHANYYGEEMTFRLLKQ